MNLTHEDVKTILEIIDRAESLDEIELVFAGLRLHVRRGSGEPIVRSAQPPTHPAIASAMPVVAAAPQSTPAKPASARELAPSEFAVRAPMIGSFYWASAPGEKPFIEVGQRVRANDTVGVIEVMKLFNTISAEVDGTVVRIEAQNATLVEFGQPLVIIAKD